MSGEDVLTGDALAERARELDIDGRSSMSADELRAAVAAAEDAPEPYVPPEVAPLEVTPEEYAAQIGERRVDETPAELAATTPADVAQAQAEADAASRE